MANPAFNKLYGRKWREYRARYLAKHPLCVEHYKKNVMIPACVVDHIKPHRGNHLLFWDTANHQALCKLCHDSYKQRLEKSGTVSGCNDDGVPSDPRHHWHHFNRGEGG